MACNLLAGVFPLGLVVLPKSVFTQLCRKRGLTGFVPHHQFVLLFRQLPVCRKGHGEDMPCKLLTPSVMPTKRGEIKTERKCLNNAVQFFIRLTLNAWHDLKDEAMPIIPGTPLFLDINMSHS